MRCATAACMPGGIVSSRPVAASSRASSATKNGWPSVRSWMAATSAAGAADAPIASTSRATSSGLSPSSGMSRNRSDRASSATLAANARARRPGRSHVASRSRAPACRRANPSGSATGAATARPRRGGPRARRTMGRARATSRSSVTTASNRRKRALSGSSADGRGTLRPSSCSSGTMQRDIPRAGVELGSEQLRLGLCDELAQALHPRPVRRRTAGLPAAADEHQRASLLRRARRPPRRATSCRSPAPRAASGACRARGKVLEVRDDRLELELAADERAVRPDARSGRHPAATSRPVAGRGRGSRSRADRSSGPGSMPSSSISLRRVRR